MLAAALQDPHIAGLALHTSGIAAFTVVLLFALRRTFSHGRCCVMRVQPGRVAAQVLEVQLYVTAALGARDRVAVARG